MSQEKICLMCRKKIKSDEFFNSYRCCGVQYITDPVDGWIGQSTFHGFNVTGNENHFVIFPSTALYLKDFDLFGEESFHHKKVPLSIEIFKDLSYEMIKRMYETNNWSLMVMR